MAEAALPLLLLPASLTGRLPLDSSASCSEARSGPPHKTGSTTTMASTMTTMASTMTTIASAMTTILHLVCPLEVVALLVSWSGTNIELPALVLSVLLDSSPGGGLATVAVNLLTALTVLRPLSTLTSMLRPLVT